MVVAEVEDENIIVPFTIWESEEDFKASIPDATAKLFSKETSEFLKSVQDGPTRAGSTSIAKDTIITTFKVRPVYRPPQIGAK